MEETSTLLDLFVNLSEEYPALLGAILITFAVIGVLISTSAVFDVMRAGHQNAEPGTWRRVAAKFLGGALLIDMTFWVNSFTETIWSYSNPMGIEGYIANSASGDAWDNAKKAVLGFLVLTGYVTLGRAYYAITRLGYASGEGRADLINTIFARIVAGTLLVANVHVIQALGESTGFNLMPG